VAARIFDAACGKAERLYARYEDRVEGGVEVQLHWLLIWALMEVCGCLTFGDKVPGIGTHPVGGWVRPVAGLNILE
jgi:hypothetical protein